MILQLHEEHGTIMLAILQAPTGPSGACQGLAALIAGVHGSSSKSGIKRSYVTPVAAHEP